MVQSCSGSLSLTSSESGPISDIRTIKIIIIISICEPRPLLLTMYRGPYILSAPQYT